MDFLTTFLNVAVLIALSIPGFILQKLKMLPEKTTNALSVILLYGCMPFLAVSSFAKKSFDSSLSLNLVAIFIIGLILSIAAFLIGSLILKPVRDKRERGALVGSSFMSNFGFMGIPVIMALFPDRTDMLIYASIFMIVGNIVSWTLSVYSVTGEKKYINIKNALLNPPTIAIYLILPFFFLGITLPSWAQEGIDYLGNMSVPLSMTVVGIRLADIKWKVLLSNYKAAISVFVKLIVVPLFSLGIMLLINLIIPIDRYVIIALYIIMAMPSLNATLLYAEKYGGDAETVTQCILLSNLFCVLSIPLLMMLVPCI